MNGGRGIGDCYPFPRSLEEEGTRTSNRSVSVYLYQKHSSLRPNTLDIIYFFPLSVGHTDGRTLHPLPPAGAFYLTDTRPSFTRTTHPTAMGTATVRHRRECSRSVPVEDSNARSHHVTLQEAKLTAPETTESLTPTPSYHDLYWPVYMASPRLKHQYVCGQSCRTEDQEHLRGLLPSPSGRGRSLLAKKRTTVSGTCVVLITSLQ